MIPITKKTLTIKYLAKVVGNYGLQLVRMRKENKCIIVEHFYDNMIDRAFTHEWNYPECYAEQALKHYNYIANKFFTKNPQGVPVTKGGVLL